MLAYRHAFHAGNHGDVLKHWILAQVLNHMVEKPKPFTLIDTHAGAGGYSLEGRYANQQSEYENGVGKLWHYDKPMPKSLLNYLNLIRDFNGGNGSELTQYPGSPAFCQTLMRDMDPLHVYELHPTDERILRSFLANRPNSHIYMQNGFEGVLRHLPTPSRRGVILIDPSYELKIDYAKVVKTVREALKKFSQAVILVWYPKVQLIEATQLPDRLIRAADEAPKGWLHATLHLQAADAKGFGMMGSGMLVINPPHTLEPTLREGLPFLASVLTQIAKPSWSLDMRLP
jgi:23S rRNA (adenine2030-N6)-methyltransferase